MWFWTQAFLGEIIMKRKSFLLAVLAVVALLCGIFSACNPVPVVESRSVDFYAINDFHGATDKMSTVSGYLTDVKYKNANSVVLNSGDMFQGSLESNYNFGNLLSDCMDEVGFDAFTLGNHEFDWGLEKLSALSKQSATPFLGANIYHWNAETRTWGDFADELAQEYTVKTLPNGLKIGIIGVIGEDNITSISSNLVQTIGFKNPATVIPELSNKLKTELNCDVVVVSAHTGEETFLEDRTFDVTQYADAVFCAHTHYDQTSYRNGVPFIQGGAYGENVSHVQLEVSSKGNVTCKVNSNVPYNETWPNKISVKQLIDNSNDQIRQQANQVLASASAYLNKNEAIPRLVSNAIAEYALSQGYDIDLAMCHVARAYLSAGEITYSDLYEAIPFDNVVYVAKVSGADILNEARYNSFWRISEDAIERDKYYMIAVLDYLLFHQDSSRNYNYFPSAFTSGFEPVPLQKDGVDVYNYRLITRDFLLSLPNGTINSTVYSNDNDRTSTNRLQYSVSF